ncbi:MAG TPA: DMT family transporter, partial [Paracoccus sp. (in: a-proteobacteria)]|nr:DMT family transporter [Paracoccus sp. (in: a-proteobacteria)]
MRTPLLSVNRRVRPASIPRARTQQGDNLRGAALMVLSMTAFTSNDAAIKFVTQTLPLPEAVAIRGAIVTLILWMVAQRDGGVAWWPAGGRDRLLLALRTGTEVVSTLLYLVVLQHMALGDLSAVMQSLPLLVMLAAALFFRERLGWRRLTAVGVGLAGVLIILRPGTSAFDIWALGAVASVLLIVVRDIATRGFSPAMRSSSVAFSAALAVTLSAPFMPADGGWRWLTAAEMAGLAISVLCLTVGYLTAVSTMRVGEVGFVSPFRYTGLV